MKLFFKINIVLISALIVFLSSCSNQKNTLMSRSYHNLTAHYNVYFNGGESFKKGLKYIDENFKDDYSRTLPVFRYSNTEIASAISADMDNAIKKGTKCISLHSIKTKPKFDKAKMTIEQKEYYNKTEFNKWIDDAYMLIGKSHFYKQDYANADETFGYVSREFSKEPTFFEAQIWNARVKIEIGDFKEAGIILDNVVKDRKFAEHKKKYEFDLLITQTDLYVKQNVYYEGIKTLEKALKMTRGKKMKLRYMFILAQLYQQTNQFNKASEMYNKIIRKFPPYEMTFNAKLNMASSTVSGTNTQSMRQLLNKMLRDAKNKDFQDQIYYAFGNVELRDGNTAKALDYYKLSVQKSTNNNAQKTLSCLTLGNFYYDHKIYIPAQAYYDTALLTIDEKYPDIESLKVKANSLTRLVKNLNTIALEDSLQKVSRLKESERIQLIDKIIANLKEKEEAEKQAESLRLQEFYNNQSRQAMLGQGDKEQQSKWYFYNQISVSQGVKDFQLKWGRRKLEDNWRRKNKGISEMFDNPNAIDESTITITEKKKVVDNKQREYYIQNIPLTDSAKEVSTMRIIDSYYEGGLVYRNELKDLPQSITLYEKMMQRYPNCGYNTIVYYQLFSMFNELKNESKADYYRNLLLTKYPESNAAKIISDTSFYKQVMLQDRIVDDYYKATYDLYNNKNYSQVLSNVQSAFERFKGDSKLALFAMLKALAINKTSDIITFRAELNKVKNNYPNHEVARYASEILLSMNTVAPESKVEEEIIEAKATYISSTDSKQFFLAMVVEKTEDVNQINFEIINFNIDNFPDDKLELKSDDMGNYFKIITVRSFTSKENALHYYKVFDSNPDTRKNVKGTTKSYFVITPENLEILKQQKATEAYIQFFKMNFLN